MFGQDGYVLFQLVFSMVYEIRDIIRRNSLMKRYSLDILPHNIRNHIIIHYRDFIDGNFLTNLLQKQKPERMYHLDGQSFQEYRFQNSHSTYDANIGRRLNVCNPAKDYSPKTRMYYASTSDLFLQLKLTHLNEMTPFYPMSPYAVSKLACLMGGKNIQTRFNQTIHVIS